MTTRFSYYAPTTWEEAVDLLKRNGAEARILAGGTDLMILLARGRAKPTCVVSLDHIPGWDRIQVDDGLTLSAGTTFRQLETSPTVRERYIALQEAARQVGGVQVRNVATVAGNLCNASPAADGVPPLLVMDASLTLYGPAGARLLPAHEFITGPRKTALGEGELLKEIHVPRLPDRTATAFLKAGRRQAMEISIVSVAVRLTLSEDEETCQLARIALGAVAPTPIRATQAEESLQGKELSPEALEHAAQLAVETAAPISDARASADYRKYLTGILVNRGLERCLHQIREGLAR